MARFHFLNVKNGDCSIIEHNSWHVSVIDICNARLPENERALGLIESMALMSDSEALAKATGARKNYGQKSKPTNPINHLGLFGINEIFRLAITHPDMDHMDGLTDLFKYARPSNYYDTENKKTMSDGWDGSPHREED
jgi:hypothetical protein